MHLIAEISDPLRGVVVWGTAGLIMWFAVAAAVGVALRALGGAPTVRPATEVDPTTTRELTDHRHAPRINATHIRRTEVLGARHTVGNQQAVLTERSA